MSRYREHPPAPDLAALVACTWERQRAAGEDGKVRILPDGCADLVWSSRGGLVVAGPDTGPVVYPLEPGYEAAGLRLRTGAAAEVLGLPLAELRDLRAPLEDVWGGDAALLGERIASAPRGERLQLLEQAVRPRTREVRADSLVLASLPLLGGRGTNVAELCRTLAISERALRRRFDRAIGYGPKKLDRILRFRRFLRRAASPGAESLAATAAELGYADQAHLNRECRRLSGLTPAELLGRA
ncbi:MAG TPA: helix-turn-helix domain-containing protein [Thermoleophilaceae bacterium]|nr:helix-turn-helix domain-containing protein [Thermoleophilaceae bacterium]